MIYRTKTSTEFANGTRILQKYKYEGQIYIDHEERVDSEGFIYEGYTLIDFETDTDLNNEDWRHRDGRKKHVRFDGEDLITLYRIGEHRCDECLHLDPYKKPCWSIHPPEVITLNNEEALVWHKGKYWNCKEEDTRCTNTTDLFMKDQNGQWVRNECYRRRYEEELKSEKMTKRQQEALSRRLKNEIDPYTAQKRKQQEWKDFWSKDLHLPSRSKSSKKSPSSQPTQVDSQCLENPQLDLAQPSQTVEPKTAAVSVVKTPSPASMHGLFTNTDTPPSSTSECTNNSKKASRLKTSSSLGTQRKRDSGGKSISIKPTCTDEHSTTSQSHKDTCTTQSEIIPIMSKKRLHNLEDNNTYIKNGNEDCSKKKRLNKNKMPQEQSSSEPEPRTIAEALYFAHFLQSDELPDDENEENLAFIANSMAYHR